MDYKCESISQCAPSVYLPGVVYVVVAAVAPHGQVAEAEGQHVLRLRGVAQAVARHIPGREDR